MIYLQGNSKECLYAVIAREFREYRKEHLLSQARFAQRLRISAQSYIDLEHGVSLPSTVTLLRWFLLMDEQEILCFLATIEEYLP